jgi:ribosomal protein S18 acetylase RimI-like enzyme
MPLVIRPMIMPDYAAVRALWASCEGVGLSSADRPEALRSYLARTPGMSCVAVREAQIVGAALCGHDGRRGYLNHLAVDPTHRRQGVARRLVAHCLAALQEAGIAKCHLFVFASNREGRSFWRHIGWELRHDLAVASLVLTPHAIDPARDG